jgi:RNA polymerase sigma factor (sigma-70 family)
MGMAESPDTSRENANPHRAGAGALGSAVNLWFMREVLPLEASLMRFLRRGWRKDRDLEDLCHDVYVLVYQAACKEIPTLAKPFVFAVARNLLINRMKREHVVSIEAVADPDTLGIALDEPGPDRSAMARQELHLLQTALNRLPHRWRDAVVMKKVEGLSRPEIAARLGIAEATVSQHLAAGMAALADIFHGSEI